MKTFPPGYNTKEIEKASKNKWRWKWLSELDTRGNKWGNWLRNLMSPALHFASVAIKLSMDRVERRQ